MRHEQAHTLSATRNQLPGILKELADGLPELSRANAKHQLQNQHDYGDRNCRTDGGFHHFDQPGKD